MRVLITGAQGFLGRALAAEWLETDPGCVVLGLGRSNEVQGRFGRTLLRGGRALSPPLPLDIGRALQSPRWAYEPADVLDRPALARILAAFRPDAVFHLAARLKDDDPAEMVRVNVEGTVNLLHAAAGAPYRPRIVLGSSGAVYGTPQALPLREEVPFGEAGGLYAVTRRAAEEAGLHLGDRNGLEVVVARLFNPIGPGLDERHLPARLAALLTEPVDEPHLRLGPLDGTRDFLDARDAAAALRLLALRGEPGLAYNVGSGRETPVRELVEVFVTAAGRAGRVRIDSAPRGRGDVPRHFADPGRLFALGFRPRHTLPESASRLVEWYRELDRAAPESRVSTRAPLRVTVEPTFAYEVEIARGLLDAVPARMRSRLGADRAVVVSDPTVAEHYGDRLMQSLWAAGYKAALCMLPEGETAKCQDVWRDLVGQLHGQGFERRSVLVNLGGALVSDVGGFVAATYMRGVPYVNVPTTLLAQHDGAIGGKVAINTPWAKNAVGAFHHPAAVYCDPETLRTLDARNLAAGVAEALKVALTGEARLFALLESRAADVMERRDTEVLERIVRLSAARKIALLAPDPLERDLRRALNLGHTLAHALETELHYAGLLHGEAVGIGLAVATEVARARGRCPEPVAARILEVLRAYGLPPRVPEARLRAALGRLDEIRRVRGGSLHFVMPTAVDAVEIVPELLPGELARAVGRVAELPASGRVEVAA